MDSKALYCVHCRNPLLENQELVQKPHCNADGELSYIMLAHIWCEPTWATPLQEYAWRCRGHDLTYQYSDSHEVWKRGVSERDAIEVLAHKINRPCVTTAIWNDAVQNFLIVDAQGPFLKSPWPKPRKDKA
jgi:hypothetical protein